MVFAMVKTCCVHSSFAWKYVCVVVDHHASLPSENGPCTCNLDNTFLKQPLLCSVANSYVDLIGGSLPRSLIFLFLHLSLYHILVLHFHKKNEPSLHTFIHSFVPRVCCNTITLFKKCILRDKLVKYRSMILDLLQRVLAAQRGESHVLFNRGTTGDFRSCRSRINKYGRGLVYRWRARRQSLHIKVAVARGHRAVG